MEAAIAYPVDFNHWDFAICTYVRGAHLCFCVTLADYVLQAFEQLGAVLAIGYFAGRTSSDFLVSDLRVKGLYAAQIYQYDVTPNPLGIP